MSLIKNTMNHIFKETWRAKLKTKATAQTPGTNHKALWKSAYKKLKTKAKTQKPNTNHKALWKKFFNKKK